MSFLEITGELILLAAVMTLLMWGLKIFKIYIIAGGVMIGAVIGMTIGLYLRQPELTLMLMTIAGALGGFSYKRRQGFFIVLP